MKQNELQSIKKYCERTEAGDLEGYRLDSGEFKQSIELAEELFSSDLVRVSGTTITRDDVLNEMRESGLWLRSGDANVTTNCVGLLIIDGHTEEAVRLHNALFTECAVDVIWGEL
jgi:hypothetical protein